MRTWTTMLAAAAVTAFLAGPALADDPKALKVTTPDGTVTVDPAKMEVETPAGNVTVEPGKVRANTAGAGVAAEDEGAGALRYNCTGNRTLTVTNKVLTASDGVVFRAAANCTLRLKNVVVTGHGIILARGNAEVIVTESALTASSVAIIAEGNAEVSLTNCTVTAPRTAVEARGNAVVNLERTAVTGKLLTKGFAEINEK